MLIKPPVFQTRQRAQGEQAFTDKLLGNAGPMRLSTTYDQGRETAMYKELIRRTAMTVYFCEPAQPWQRGSNKNTNGMAR